MRVWYFKIVFSLILIVLFSAQPGFAQPSDEVKKLRKEVEELKEDQKAIQKDLQQIKTLLQSQGLLPEEPKNLFLDITGKPLRGNKDARLVLVEFSEYQ